VKAFGAGLWAGILILVGGYGLVALLALATRSNPVGSLGPRGPYGVTLLVTMISIPVIAAIGGLIVAGILKNKHRSQPGGSKENAGKHGLK